MEKRVRQKKGKKRKGGEKRHKMKKSKRIWK